MTESWGGGGLGGATNESPKTKAMFITSKFVLFFKKKRNFGGHKSFF